MQCSCYVAAALRSGSSSRVTDSCRIRGLATPGDRPVLHYVQTWRQWQRHNARCRGVVFPQQCRGRLVPTHYRQTNETHPLFPSLGRIALCNYLVISVLLSTYVFNPRNSESAGRYVALLCVRSRAWNRPTPPKLLIQLCRRCQP